MREMPERCGKNQMNKPILPVFHPNIMRDIEEINYGLIPFFSPSSNKYVLVVKTTKENILSVDVRNEFKCYLVKNTSSIRNYLGLVTAFFDDIDEPSTIRTPLFSDDPMLVDIIKLFSQQNFDIFFFDENNSEMLRAKAINVDHQRFNNKITRATFPKFQQDKILKTWEDIARQFALRTEEDDFNSFEIKIHDKIYINESGLIRERNPGSMQEEEITELFRRIFKKHEIYLNPIRADKIKKEKRELVDILIITNNVMLFVQAKDSPNTPDSIERSMDRRRKTIRNHIKKANNQLRGSLKYARNHDGVTILLNRKPVHIKLGKRQPIGLIVVQELLDNDCLECGAPVLKLVKELNLPVILLDYPQLHILTKNIKMSSGFFWSLFDMVETALENNHFPRYVFSGNKEVLVDIEEQELNNFFQHDDRYWNMSDEEANQLFTNIRKISRTRRRYKESHLESQMSFKDFYDHIKIKHKEELEDYYRYEGFADNGKEIDIKCVKFYIGFLTVLNNLNPSEMQNRIMYFIGGVYVRIWNISTPKYPIVKPYMVTLSKDEKFCATEEELKGWTQKWNKSNTFYYIETQDNRCRVYYY